MSVLWAEAPLTLHQIHDRLTIRPRLAYTTVQTMLNVLHRKGHVSRQLEGRGYRYSPVTTRGRAAKEAVSDVVRKLFSGSVDDFLMAFLDAEEIGPARVAELARKVAREKGKKRDG